MDSPVFTLVIALFFVAIIKSHQIVNWPLPREFSSPPPRRPLPLPPESSPTPPHVSFPSPLTPPPVSPHPPFSPRQPLQPPLASVTPLRPLSQSPQPTSRSSSPHRLSPSSDPPPPPRKYVQSALPEHGYHNSFENFSPPIEKEKPNAGKKIGLMFIGIAAIMQVCILAFLLIRRRQLLQSENGC